MSIQRKFESIVILTFIYLTILCLACVKCFWKKKFCCIPRWVIKIAFLNPKHVFLSHCWEKLSIIMLFWTIVWTTFVWSIFHLWFWKWSIWIVMHCRDKTKPLIPKIVVQYYYWRDSSIRFSYCMIIWIIFECSLILICCRRWNFWFIMKR